MYIQLLSRCVFPCEDAEKIRGVALWAVVAGVDAEGWCVEFAGIVAAIYRRPTDGSGGNSAGKFFVVCSDCLCAADSALYRSSGNYVTSIVV